MPPPPLSADDTPGPSRPPDRLAVFPAPDAPSAGGADDCPFGRRADRWVDAVSAAATNEGWRVATVSRPAPDLAAGARRFAQRVLWPLLHGFTPNERFEPDLWAAYLQDNRRCARHLARCQPAASTLWIYGVPWLHIGHHVRQIEPKRADLGFFLDASFPGPATLARCPWHRQIMGALLSYDWIGVQSDHALNNVVRCVRRLAPTSRIDRHRGHYRIDTGRRVVGVQTCPVGIDVDSTRRRAGCGQTTRRLDQLDAAVGEQSLVVGVDRLDSTAGTLDRLRAWERLLVERPDLRRRAVLYQIVQPLADQTPPRRALKAQIERVIGRICGRFSTSSWAPIWYRYGAVSAGELTAIYRRADLLVLTPRREAMTPAANTFVACQVDPPGAVVLSEFSGSADQLADGPVVVNPYDRRATAAGIADALDMPADERRRRHRRSLNKLRRDQDHRWAKGMLGRPAGRVEPTHADMPPTRGTDRSSTDRKPTDAGPAEPSGRPQL